MKNLLSGDIKQNYLNAKNSEYDKKRAADKDNISYWTQWRQQSHYNQLQAWSTIDYSAQKNIKSNLGQVSASVDNNNSSINNNNRLTAVSGTTRKSQY